MVMELDREVTVNFVCVTYIILWILGLIRVSLLLIGSFSRLMAYILSSDFFQMIILVN